MKAADRDAEMARFRDGDLDVLVGTTVVEVGVDVPEATVMVVEGADRFGLAQLHQLRGRVGRGTVESYCVLVSRRRLRRPPGRAAQAVDASCATASTWPRRTSSCAREGDVLGLAQSGLPQLRVASLAARRPSGSRRRAPALTPRRCSTTRGALTAGHDALARELDGRLAARIAAGEPARREVGMADAGRVIAGSRARASGCWLRAPGRGRWRDRVKQTLFAILEPDLPGARVLDLFAGSGAAGIEALSRGASAVVRRARRRRVPRHRAPTWRGPGSPVRRPGRARGRSRPGCGSDAGGRPFDVVVVDPPYAEPAELLARARRAPGRTWLARGRRRRRSTSGAAARRRSGC